MKDCVLEISKIISNVESFGKERYVIDVQTGRRSFCIRFPL